MIADHPDHAKYPGQQIYFVVVLDEITKNREVVIIQRSGSEDVALITADELAGILEIAYLLRSPNNAKRLLVALDRVRKA